MAESAWLADLQQMVYLHKWLAVSCRSSAGQGKLAGQRPTFYHCNTQTNQDVIPEQKKPTGADPKIPNLYIHGVTLRAADTKAWPMVKCGVDVDFRTCRIADVDADVKDC